MILVIEGINGAGKTTLARDLAAAYGFHQYKPFYPPGLSHWNTPEGVERRAQMARLGVPVNTHVEDLFLADFYGKYSALNVVLDRSMPSAIAYESVPPENVNEAFSAWQSALGRHPFVAYVTLVCDEATVAARVAPERVPTPAKYRYISEAFEWAHDAILWPKVMIDTSARSVPSVRTDVRDFFDGVLARLS